MWPKIAGDEGWTATWRCQWGPQRLCWEHNPCLQCVYVVVVWHGRSRVVRSRRTTFSFQELPKKCCRLFGLVEVQWTLSSESQTLVSDSWWNVMCGLCCPSAGKFSLPSLQPEWRATCREVWCCISTAWSTLWSSVKHASFHEFGEAALPPWQEHTCCCEIKLKIHDGLIATKRMIPLCSIGDSD